MSRNKMSDHTHVQDKHSRDFYNMHLCINPMYQGGCRLSRRVLRLLCAGFEQGEYQSVSTLLVLHITVITQNAIAMKSLIFLGGSPRSGVWRGFRHLRTTGGRLSPKPTSQMEFPRAQRLTPRYYRNLSMTRII